MSNMVKYKLMDLKKKEYEVDMDKQQTVLDMKKKVENLYDFSVPTIKLIQSGKVLKDDDKLETFDENSPFVLFINKKKQPPSVPVTASAVDDNSLPPVESIATATATATATTATATATTATATTTATTTATAPVVDNEPGETKTSEEVARIITMLSVGLIKILENPTNRLQILKQIPTFKALYDENPEKFNEAVQNPNFMDMFTTTLVTTSLTKTMGSGGMGFLPPVSPTSTVTLSPEDEKNVTEIMSILGSSKAEVIDAYIACEKNKEAAINFLLNV